MRARRITGVLGAVTLTLLAGCQPEGSEGSKEVSVVQSLEQAENPPPLKPRFEAAPLPDFGAINEVGAKKAAFFAYLTPMVEEQNRRVAALHQHLGKLDRLLQTQGALHPKDQIWLDTLAERYRVDAAEPAARIEALRRKIGPLPAALVLAQAANESAWGTSRFAREGNNLFGQWCFTPGCGLAPLKRDAGDTHEVQAFDSVADAVYSYFVNLNGNASYRELREIRRCLDGQTLPLRGRALAAGLDRYSARGNHYVKELRAMMRINALEPWPADWWGNTRPDHPCYSLVQVEVKKPDPLTVIATASAAIPTAEGAAPSLPASAGLASLAASASVASSPATSGAKDSP